MTSGVGGNANGGQQPVPQQPNQQRFPMQNQQQPPQSQPQQMPVSSAPATSSAPLINRYRTMGSRDLVRNVN